MKQLTLGILALLIVVHSVTATSVLEPTLDELVSRAEQIFVGRVVAVRSNVVTSRVGRSIVTDVTFAIERTLKGSTYAERSLEFLGGTVGDETLRVAGMPMFRVGDRDVLFVSEAGRPVSPIVGFMYGRFRITRDAGRGVDVVRTHDGRPLTTLADIGSQRLPAAIGPAQSLPLAGFLGEIERRVRALEPQR